MAQVTRQVGELVSDLVSETNNYLTGLDHRLVNDFLSDWPVSDVNCSLEPNDLPVLRYMAEIAVKQQSSQKPEQVLVARLADLTKALVWRQTYTADDFGANFLDGYGWTMIVGPGGLLASDNLLCAVLMLGPEIEYPFHSHQAEEIYVPIAGLPAFRLEGQPWRSRPPGEVVHHTPWLAHALCSGDEPCLILSLWRNGDLGQKSRIGLSAS